MERHASTAQTERELTKAERELRKLVQAMKDGVAVRPPTFSSHMLTQTVASLSI